MSPCILARDGPDDSHVPEALLGTKSLANGKQESLLKTPGDVTFIPPEAQTGRRRIVIGVQLDKTQDPQNSLELFLPPARWTPLIRRRQSWRNTMSRT